MEKIEKIKPCVTQFDLVFWPPPNLYITCSLCNLPEIHIYVEFRYILVVA